MENLGKKKKIIIGIIIGIIFVVIIPITILTLEKKLKEERQRKAEEVIGFSDNVEVEVYSDTTLEEVVNKSNILITDDRKINTDKLGKQEIKFHYIYAEEEFTKKINLEVVDTTSPTIFASSSYTVTKGSDRDFTTYILAGDNYDDKPIRKIIGDYNPNKVGTYELSYYIEDSSGNSEEQGFTVKVIEKPKTSSGGGTTTSSSRKKFSDVIENYKTEDTEIGIDVSKWQGTIDFQKVKEAGCEFVIIRMGHQNGIDGEIILDPYYKRNVDEATKVGLKVGAYIYTYAKSKDDAVKQAKWVLSNMGDYQLPLGISYDWESWTSFSKLNLSYHSFTDVAGTFIKELEKNNQKGMIYSSKYYLENIWTENDYDTWLAHYTQKTNYKGKYHVWQMTSSGQIDGINGAVDIDILYKNR